MDDIIKTNRERWNALANADVEWSRPYLNYTHAEAEENIYRHGILKDVSGKQVLCLASGGGQDSVAFGLLGANVTVLDLSDVQLERDPQAAAHHGLQTKTVQGDMRDLSVFAENQFDIVWQVYSINFVPSVEPVFQGVRRALKPGGIYFLQFANPFTIGVDEEQWDGKAYPLNSPYTMAKICPNAFPTGMWNSRMGPWSSATARTNSVTPWAGYSTPWLGMASSCSACGNGCVQKRTPKPAPGHTSRRPPRHGSVHFGSCRSNTWPIITGCTLSNSVISWKCSMVFWMKVKKLRKKK